VSQLGGEAILRPIVCNVFINDLGDKIELTLSKFGDDMKLGGGVAGGVKCRLQGFGSGRVTAVFSVRISQGLPCAGHTQFQSVSARCTMDPLPDTVQSTSKVGAAFVEMYLSKSRKHWRERERDRKRERRMELKGNNRGTPSSEKQQVLCGGARTHQQGQQLVEDPCRSKFSLKGKWHMDDAMPEQL